MQTVITYEHDLDGWQTPPSQFLTNRKSYVDLTGNGVNHPNDFGHRLSAQVLRSVLTNLF